MIFPCESESSNKNNTAIPNSLGSRFVPTHFKGIHLKAFKKTGNFKPVLKKLRKGIRFLPLIIDKTQLCQHQHFLNCQYWIFNFKDLQFVAYLDLP